MDTNVEIVANFDGEMDKSSRNLRIESVTFTVNNKDMVVSLSKTGKLRISGMGQMKVMPQGSGTVEIAQDEY